MCSLSRAFDVGAGTIRDRFSLALESYPRCFVPAVQEGNSPPNPAPSVRLSLDIKLKCLKFHMAPSWSLFLSTMEASGFSLEFPSSPHILGLTYSWSSQLQSHDWSLSSSLAIWTHCLLLNRNLFCEQMFPRLLSQGSSAVVPGGSPGCFHHEYSV